MALWQEEMARFGLFPFENEIKNRSWTCTMIHSASLATFYPKIFLVNFAIPVKEQSNPKQPSCKKKSAALKKAIVKKDVKSVAASSNHLFNYNTVLYGNLATTGQRKPAYVKKPYQQEVYRRHRLN